MTVLMQVVINGILLGSMYGIAAAGLSLIFGTMRIIFLAQGTMIVFFAFVVYWLFVKAHIDPYLSLLIVVPFAFLVGLGLFYSLFRKAVALEDRNVTLLLAVGLMYLVDNAMLKVWSATPRSVTISYSDAMIVAGDIRVPWLRLALLGLALVSAFVVFLFLKRTRVGTAVRAASEDLEATAIQGINAVWVCAISFAIGIGLAGVAGVGLATVFSFDYQFGFTWAIKALVALALGGIGNVFGALAGGLILGIIENLAAYYWGIAWIDVASYGLFMLVLIFLPQGLFGRRALVKKV
ncbi:MAG TPA: branched-chain amino acid ABC transporter permease [Thermoleophilia bacterium]|nr:branched-chain amino acid ABC transporter permease [Thermoleophilia bacterium]